MQEIIDSYINTQYETDPQRRRVRVDAVWAEQATYLGRFAEAHRRDALIAGKHPPQPGRFTWALPRRGRADRCRRRRRGRQRGRLARQRPRLPRQAQRELAQKSHDVSST